MGTRYEKSTSHYVNPLQLSLRPAFLAQPFNALVKQSTHGLQNFNRGVAQVLRRPGAWRFEPAQLLPAASCSFSLW